MSARARLLRLGLCLALGAGLAGCASSGLRQAQEADDLREYDLAVARYSRVLRDHPDNREAKAGLDRAKVRASEEHLIRGRRLSAQGRYEDAVVELQVAAELNPANADAARDLHEARVALRSELNAESGGPTSLESLLARTRDLGPGGFELPNITLTDQITTGQQSTARSVFMLLAELGNLSVTFDSQFRDVPAPVSLRSGMTLRQAFDAVAAATSTFYQIIGQSTLLVAPDTPLKRREYVDEVVRPFTIQNVDLKEAMDALRIVADARYIAPVSGTNTILVRDTPQRVQAIGRIIAAFDKARPELVVSVEVLEVDRSRLREYGLQFASPGSTGISGSADANREEGITLQTLRNLSQADVMITNIPALYYRLLKTDSRTRTLANPHVRMSDGVAGVANFGQDVPVPSLRVAPITQGGLDIQPQTQFDYRKIGVNISITPRTHPNDDVTLALNIELSSLGAPGFDGLPTFGTRNVQTAIRLKDGETNILAGLIREDERVDRDSIPGIGSVPVLRQIFGRTRREAQQTDVVIMLTPHIIRVLDIVEDDLRPMRLPREGGGGIVIDQGPTTIPPPQLEPVPRDPLPPRPQAPPASTTPTTPSPTAPVPRPPAPER